MKTNGRNSSEMLVSSSTKLWRRTQGDRDFDTRRSENVVFGDSYACNLLFTDRLLLRIFLCISFRPKADSTKLLKIGQKSADLLKYHVDRT
jgi:hypothetical protein